MKSIIDRTDKLDSSVKVVDKYHPGFYWIRIDNEILKQY